MRKFINLIFISFSIFFCNYLFAHVNHYKNIKYLEYDLFLNNKLIGSHSFNFIHKKNLLYVNTKGQFNVSKIGIDLMDYSTKTEEIYDDGQLIRFKSSTVQNDKKKYVNLKLDKNKKLFHIDGSSFNGTVETAAIIGSWWNHDIIKKNKQISAVSGRIIPQKVSFLGKKNINLNGKEYNSLHFHFLSDDNKPIEKKKINLHVWYDENTLLWLKMSYEKFGKWEYRLKTQSFY